MKYNKYGKYKPIECDWLAEIPEHWQVIKIRHLFQECDRSNKGMVEQNLLSLSYGKIIPKDINSNDGLMPESFETYQIVYPGEIVFRFTDMQNDDRSLRSAIVEKTGIITSAYMALRLLSGESRYFNYLFRAYDLIKVFYRMGGGLRQSLNFMDVRDVQLLFPPIEEQGAIADFLDRETARIDALISEQGGLIEGLREKRAGMVSHFATKGLNPNAPMKPSGIPWLGDVPQHWIVGKCGFYIVILPGFAFPSSGFTEEGQGIRLLRGINVGIGQLKWDETVYWDRADGDGLGSFELMEGDLVIGMDRPLISEGMRVARVKSEDLPCLLLQRVALIRPRPGLNPEYFYHLLASDMFIAHFLPETTGISVPHISGDQISSFVIPIPPIDEQEHIARKLAKDLGSIDALIREAQLSMDLLQEHRSALITAVVTGKVDVRDAVKESA